MPEWISNILSIIYNDLLLPVLSIIIVVIIKQVTSKLNTVMDSTNDRNHKESLNAVSSITTQAMAQLDSVVSSAVAYTMKLAEAYKADDTPKLTEDEIIRLNCQAKELTYEMLPTEITNGSLLTILGGQQALESMITAAIEKQLIVLRSNPNNKNT